MRNYENCKALVIEVLIVIGSCLCKILGRRTANGNPPDEEDY